MTNIVKIENQSNLITNNNSTANTVTATAPSNPTISTNSAATNNSSTISNNNHNAGSGGSSSSAIKQETCLICGDVASGKHYGLRSCEACKAFFKRTVQGKIEYSCPATRECEINKRRRKACQACRFQKCLNMGMLKEGVRLDRVRGGRQKYRRGTSPSTGLSGGSNGGATGGACSGSSCSTGLSNINNNSSFNGAINSNGIIGQTNSLSSPASSSLAANTSGISGHIAYPLGDVTAIAATHQQTAIGTGETNKIMTALINCEPEELSASPGQYVTNVPANLSVQLKTLYILSDLFDRELVSLIGWAKQIPGFSETITLNDQMRLLQSTWAEVIALSIGYRSHLKRIENFKQQQLQPGNSSIHHFMNTTTPSPNSSSPASTTSSSYNNNSNPNNNSIYNLETAEIRLVFAKDLIIDFKHATTCGADEIFYNCVQLIKRLEYLRITPKEFILLKAISLMNADVRLENPRATFRLRDLVMDALYEVTLTECLNGGQMGNGELSNMKQDISGNKNGSGNSSGSNNNQHQQHQLKIETQDRPPSSMNQYTSSSSSPTPPSRSSSSMPSSSSTSSISTHNNSNIINNNLDVNKKTIINNRMNQVLLCLPVLRQIDSSIRKFWNDIRKGPNNVPMNKLFEEMLEPCQRMYRSSVEM